MSEQHIWYFAYGSNLNMGQMMTRVGEWKTSARATLKEYQLLFNVKSSRWGGMAANIRNTSSLLDIVYGAIYLILESKLAVMTDYERVEPQPVIVESGVTEIEAMTYIFTRNRAAGRPPNAYINTLLIGLRQHGYQEDIVEKVRDIAESA